jgi:hypothetical protein
MIDFFTQLTLKGIEVREHSSEPDEFKICCLFCPERNQGLDFKFRLGFNIKSGLGHCFKCSWSSRKALLDILRQIGSDSFEEIRAEAFTQRTRERPEPVDFPVGFEKLKDITDDDPVFGRARHYVRKRGITPRQLRTHEIGATVLDEKFHHMIVFPVRYGNLLAGMVGRDWTGKRCLPYENSVGNKCAYNVHPEKYEMGTKIVVVSEGIPKALAIERATEYKLVSSATMGNSITAIQSNQLKQFDEVVFFVDPDIVGMTGYLAAADNLQPLVKKVSMVWPWPEEQADKMQDSEIRETLAARKEVTPLLRMHIRSLMRDR